MWYARLTIGQPDEKEDELPAKRRILRLRYRCPHVNFNSSEHAPQRVDKFRSDLGPAELRAGPFCVRSRPYSVAGTPIARFFAIRPLPELETMPEIHLSDTDRLDWALKAFKKMMQKSGILATLRQKRHYTKPSQARQLKSKAAQRTRQKAARARRRS